MVDVHDLDQFDATHAQEVPGTMPDPLRAIAEQDHGAHRRCPQPASARLGVDPPPEHLGLLAPGAITRRAPSEVRTVGLSVDPQPRPQRRDRAHLHFVPAIPMEGLHAVHRDSQHTRVNRRRRRTRSALPRGVHVRLLIGFSHRADPFRVPPRRFVGHTHAEHVARRVHRRFERTPRCPGDTPRGSASARAPPDRARCARRGAPARTGTRRTGRKAAGWYSRPPHPGYAASAVGPRGALAPTMRAGEALRALMGHPSRQHPFHYLTQDRPPHRLQPPF